LIETEWRYSNFFLSNDLQGILYNNWNIFVIIEKITLIQQTFLQRNSLSFSFDVYFCYLFKRWIQQNKDINTFHWYEYTNNSSTRYLNSSLYWKSIFVQPILRFDLIFIEKEIHLDNECYVLTWGGNPIPTKLKKKSFMHD